MMTALLVTTLAAAAALPESAQAVVNDWMSKPVLTEGTTDREVRAFVVNRVPAIQVPATASEWQDTSDTLRERMLADLVYRGVPAEWYQGPLNVEWADTIEIGKSYRIRKLRYEAVPGLWIPALLYEPETLEGKAPAVLSVNGHVGAPGKSVEFAQARCINLAKRGVLALHPEWLFFGELNDPGYRHNDSAYLDLCGVSGLSIFYQAMKRGLDVLADHPSVDPERIAMTGLSGGGWQTITLSSLDPRIRLSVPNAGYIGLAVRTDFPQDIGDLEQIPVDLLMIADYTHLTAMLAPRPALLIYNVKDDCCFQSDRAWPSVYEPIVPFYALFDAAPRFQKHENLDPGTHNYDLDNRLALYRFLSEQWNLGWPDEEPSFDGEIRTLEELAAGVPEGNATFHSLAKQQMQDLPQPLDGTDDEKRKALADVIRWKPATGRVQINDEQTSEGFAHARGILKVGSWSVPFVLFEPEDPAATATTVLLADAGKGSVAEPAAALLEQGHRVVAIDVLYHGECAPAGTRQSQSAMMIDATGAHLLGEQVKQLTAVLAAAKEEYGSVPLHVQATGPHASLIALAAGALRPDQVDEVRTTDAPVSLKDSLANGIRYDDAPSLFTFGLLRHFDIADIQALCPAFVGE